MYCFCRSLRFGEVQMRRGEVLRVECYRHHEHDKGSFARRLREVRERKLIVTQSENKQGCHSPHTSLTFNLSPFFSRLASLMISSSSSSIAQSAMKGSTGAADFGVAACNTTRRNVFRSAYYDSALPYGRNLRQRNRIPFPVELISKLVHSSTRSTPSASPFNYHSSHFSTCDSHPSLSPSPSPPPQ